MDSVQYARRGLTKRTYIRKSLNSVEKSYITVPIVKADYHALIKDIKINASENWQTKTLNQLKNIYQDAPFFEENFDFLNQILLSIKGLDHLADINISILKAFSDLLKFDTMFCNSSDLPVSGKSYEYLIDLTKCKGGDVYLSGMGGKNYHDEVAFEQAGIKLEYQNLFKFLTTNSYPQSQGSFLNGLSVVDALFNIGVDGIIALFEAYDTTTSRSI